MHADRRVRLSYLIAAGLFAVAPMTIHKATMLIWSTSAEVFVLAIALVLQGLLVGHAVPALVERRRARAVTMPGL